MRTSKNATGGEEDLNFLDTLERHNNSSKSFIVHNNWKQKVDFIELNYYRRVHIRTSPILSISDVAVCL